MQLSFDQEKTWRDAAIEPPQSPWSWVVWNYQRPDMPVGKSMISVRAVDTAGTVQTSTITRPQPNGATGLHSIVVNVFEA